MSFFPSISSDSLRIVEPVMVSSSRIMPSLFRRKNLLFSLSFYSTSTVSSCKKIRLRVIRDCLNDMISLLRLPGDGLTVKYCFWSWSIRASILVCIGIGCVMRILCSPFGSASNVWNNVFVLRIRPFTVTALGEMCA